MRKVIVVTMLFISANAFCQMFVSPNSYVYVNDRVLYVTQDINLQNSGNIYLRDQSQLLQGTPGISANTGLGKLSVFQEGTSDNYDYNYWCSPVGNSSAASGNENFGITMLNMPTGLITSSPATILGPTALDGLASPLSIAPRWIYRYINSSLYSQWVLAGSTSTIAAGEGFTMKGTSGTDGTVVSGVQNNPGSAQRYDFRGKPNDGNISVTVGTNNQTLTGNPYPSALHVNAFLLDTGNAACNGNAYYWQQKKGLGTHYLNQYQGGYGTYSPFGTLPTDYGLYAQPTFDTYDGSGNLNTTGMTSAPYIQRKYAPIGQGFMIQGSATGISVTIKNAHRSYYKESGMYSQFERENGSQIIEPQPAAISHFGINAIMNNQATRQVILAFHPNATDGWDRGMDGESPEGEGLPNDVYFPLDSKKFVIEAVDFDITKRIPLGVKSASNSTFRFSIPEVINFDENQAVYIYDALDASYHNIKTGYNEVTLDEGTFNDRFEITFLDAFLNVPHVSDSDIDILQNNNLQLLTISNPTLISLTSCILYDMAGKMIFNEKLSSDAGYNFSTNSLSEGVYIVKLTTPNGEDITKKISIFKQKN